MTKTILISIALTVLLVEAAALADVPPPNTFGCQNAAADDACVTDDSKKGVCVKDTCSRLDYSNVNDAGVPGSRTYECLICTPKSSDNGCAAAPFRSAESDLFRLIRALWK